MDITQLLQLCRQLQASDVHISTGEAVMVRCAGSLQRLESSVCHAARVQQLLQPLCTAAALPSLDDLAAQGECDFALTWPEVGRLRINLFAQQRGWSAAVRLIPEQLPAWHDLGLPLVLQAWAAQPSGLVLVVGATGSGKSTTLAALLHHINHHRAAHIITLEDPIEYLHTPQQSLIHQRELGLHSPSWDSALRAALRQDPDVLLIGELRDLPSIRLALTAAETGHLVLATLHANSAPSALERMVSVFPSDEQTLVRQQLAASLVGVMAQTLCASHGQRQLAHEVLSATAAVRNVVREGRLEQLVSLMQTGGQHGMHTLAQSLAQLSPIHAVR